MTLSVPSHLPPPMLSQRLKDKCLHMLFRLALIIPHASDELDSITDSSGGESIPELCHCNGLKMFLQIHLVTGLDQSIEVKSDFRAENRG